MSDIVIENIIEEQKVLKFQEAIPVINEKYINFLKELIEKFKYHDELIGSLESDLKLITDKLPDHEYQIINTITANFLFCLEQVCDNNSDYFIYQKEKVTKKNGKVFKNKLPKVGNKTLFKKILKEVDTKFSGKIFKEIIDLFILLTFKNENEVIVFNNDYIEYVKDNFTENKNYSKMIMVFDNIDNILNIELGDDNEVDSDAEDLVEISESKNKKDKKSKGKKNSPSLGTDFMKGLENTKIAQLARNISEKINISDFPSLSDPSKLLSSLGNPSEEGGIQNLLKFVVGEVEEAFKGNNLNEKDLIGEAQNIMGQFKNMSGFDPMSMLKDNPDFDINQFANIFSKMSK